MAKTPEELQVEIDALKANNTDLLKEKKAAKAAADDLAARLEKLETDSKKVKDEAEADAAKKAGDWAKVEAQLKASHAAEIDKLNKTIADLNTARDRLVIADGLKAQLTAANVPAALIPAVEALMKTRDAKVEIDAQGNFVGKIGDKPLADYVKEWAASEEGKHFIPADNSGGGAPGAGKGGKTTPGNPYAKATLNRTQQGLLEKTDPDKARRLQAEAASAA